MRRLIRALLVLRLESVQLPLDAGLVLAMWHSRPTIEIVIQAPRDAAAHAQALRRRIDEVYPF